MKLRLVILSCCAVLVLATPSWARKVETIYTNYRLNTVELETQKSKTLRGRAVAHPATVSVEKMREMLRSVQLHRTAFMKKDRVVEDRSAFNEEAVTLLAPYFVEALRQATPEQFVAFSYLTKNPDSVLRNDRLMIGKVWVEDDGLHMEFGKLFARIDGDLSKRGFQKKAVSQARGLRIVLEPGVGQSLGNSMNELVFDLGADFVAATNGAIDRKTGYSQVPSKRLEELKRLREMNLIDDDEYEAKRREVLQDL